MGLKKIKDYENDIKKEMDANKKEQKEYMKKSRKDADYDSMTKEEKEEYLQKEKAGLAEINERHNSAINTARKAIDLIKAMSAKYNEAVEERVEELRKKYGDKIPREELDSLVFMDANKLDDESETFKKVDQFLVEYLYDKFSPTIDATKRDIILTEIGGLLLADGIRGYKAVKLNKVNDACFLAGTLVLTSDGEIPIEKIKAGTKVWSYDFASNSWVLAVVESPMEHNYDGLVYTINAAGETVEATADHPFWILKGENLEDRPAPKHVSSHEKNVEQGRWVDTKDLNIGDIFLLKGKKTATVKKISARHMTTMVYNMKVKEYFNYCVSKAGILVHNKAMRWSGEGPVYKTAQEATEAAEQMGFKKISRGSAPFDSHGQPVFKRGNNYLSPDADGHNGGAWKMFDSKGRRLGTYDKNMNRIKD